MHKPHKDLKVWQRGMDMVMAVYRLTAQFPSEEKYGLSSQMRRAGVSVVSNIAEGAARQGNAEFVQFLHVSLGSVSELDTQLELARRLGFVRDEDWQRLDGDLQEIDRMLIGLRNSLRKQSSS
ncbi:MAG: four helix bundle protein [Pirellulales bacterium]